jgi:integrase
VIERRGNSWRARYRGPDGRERNKTFQRKGDAERWLTQQRSLMAQGDWTDPARGRITFGDYAEAWLESRADLKPKTRHQYQWLMRQYIMPIWRTVPLAKITFEGLTHWVSRLSVSGLGPSGIRQCVSVMSAALDHAVRSERIRSNPARGLGLPRPKRRDYVYLTHAQVLALAAEAGRGRLLILLLAYTGLRWGEATALRVCDIDLDRRRADVRRAFSDVGGRVILGTPKSHQSRTVPLPRFLAVEIAAAVAGKHADQLVFTMPGGGVMRLPNWRRSVFLSARGRAGLSDRFRVHDLRHTAASQFRQATRPRCCKRSWAMPASPRPWTCTGTCTQERWTATPTVSTRRPRCLIRPTMRPKSGQMTTKTSRTKND